MSDDRSDSDVDPAHQVLDDLQLKIQKMGEDLLMLREQTREDFLIPEVESDMEVEDADDDVDDDAEDAKEEEDDDNAEVEVEEEVENDDNDEEEDEIEREEEDGDDNAEMEDEEEVNMEEEEKEREEKNDAQDLDSLMQCDTVPKQGQKTQDTPTQSLMCRAFNMLNKDNSAAQKGQNKDSNQKQTSQKTLEQSSVIIAGPSSGLTPDPTSGPSSIPDPGATANPAPGSSSDPAPVSSSDPAPSSSSNPASGPSSIPAPGSKSIPNSGSDSYSDNIDFLVAVANRKKKLSHALNDDFENEDEGDKETAKSPVPGPSGIGAGLSSAQQSGSNKECDQILIVTEDEDEEDIEVLFEQIDVQIVQETGKKGKSKAPYKAGLKKEIRSRYSQSLHIHDSDSDMSSDDNNPSYQLLQGPFNRDYEKTKNSETNTTPTSRLIPIKKEETSTPATVIKKCVVKVKNILDLTNDGIQDLSAVPDIQIPAQSGSTTSLSYASWITGKRAETASENKLELASEIGSQTPSVSRTEGSSDSSTTLDVSGSGLGAPGSGAGASGSGAGASGSEAGAFESKKDDASDFNTESNRFFDVTGIAQIQELQNELNAITNTPVVAIKPGTKPRQKREDRLNLLRYKTQMSRINNQDQSSEDEFYVSSDEGIGHQHPPRSYMSSTSNRPRCSMISIGKMMPTPVCSYRVSDRETPRAARFDKYGMLRRPSNRASNRIDAENPEDFQIMAIKRELEEEEEKYFLCNQPKRVRFAPDPPTLAGPSAIAGPSAVAGPSAIAGQSTMAGPSAPSAVPKPADPSAVAGPSAMVGPSGSGGVRSSNCNASSSPVRPDVVPDTNRDEDDPEPGCSYWVKKNSVSQQQQGDTSSSSIPVNWDIKYNELLATHIALLGSLQTAVECPICFEVPRNAPVPCCKNGHVFCEPCLGKGNIAQCPTCKVPMSPAQRCVSNVANRILDLIPHPCKFKEAGCQHEAQVDGLKSHEKGCEYRTVKCPLFSCKKSFAIKALADHFDDDSTHDEMRAITAVPVTFTMVLKHGQNPEPNAPKRVKFDGRMFYLQCISSTDHKYLYNFVQMEGNLSQCCQYKAHLSIISEDPSVEPIKHSIPITSLDLHCVDDFNNIGFMMVVTNMVLQDYLTIDPETGRSFFKLHLKITKLDKAESDKLLAKVEKAGDASEKEKNAQEKLERERKEKSDKDSADKAQLRAGNNRIITAHVSSTMGHGYRLAEITPSRRILMLEYSTRHLTVPLTRQHPLLTSELRAYQTATSKEDYLIRVKRELKDYTTRQAAINRTQLLTINQPPGQDLAPVQPPAAAAARNYQDPLEDSLRRLRARHSSPTSHYGIFNRDYNF